MMPVLYTFTVANPPTLLQLEQIALTSVRVKWTNTAGGAPVTLYGIHYSDGINPRIKVVPATMTTTNITGLATGGTYTFSVEAGSEHLSGESQERTITLCEFAECASCVYYYKYNIKCDVGLAPCQKGVEQGRDNSM